MRNTYLIGFMGAGKSTVAKELARAAGVECVEMDEEIEARQGMPITEIFETYGEEHFRDLETEFLKSIAGKENLVVSCGGGSVLREENAALMRESGCIVFLTATPETVCERVKDSAGRPILNGNMNVAYIRELMEKRRGCYEAAADVRIATDGKAAAEICREVLAAIRDKAGD